MPTLPYDPRVASLLHPQAGESFFKPGGHYDDVQLGVEASRLAYIRAEDRGAEFARLATTLRIAGFGQMEHFNLALGTQAFSAFRVADRTALVAFRGTEIGALQDIGIDAAALVVPWEGAGQVHAGFAAAFAAIGDTIPAWIREKCGDCRLVLCGHSLGGALAVLAASRWNAARLVTIGQPRVGDADFIASLAGVDYTRLINCCDLVPRLPPPSRGYAHGGTAHYITHAGTVLVNPHVDEVNNDRHLGRGQYFEQFAGRAGNAPTRDVADHAPVNYVRAVLP